MARLSELLTAMHEAEASSPSNNPEDGPPAAQCWPVSWARTGSILDGRLRGAREGPFSGRFQPKNGNYHAVIMTSFPTPKNGSLLRSRICRPGSWTRQAVSSRSHCSNQRLGSRR